MKKIKNENYVEVMDIDTNEELNEEENEMNVTPKWSLQKKLMLGGGILAGLVLGAVALGSKKAKDTNEACCEFDENNEEEVTEETSFNEA